ncbi:hypothetical protein RFI_39031, partial [Reticulomyxa filosa]
MFDPSLPIQHKQLFPYLNDLKKNMSTAAKTIDLICERMQKIRTFSCTTLYCVQYLCMCMYLYYKCKLIIFDKNVYIYKLERMQGQQSMISTGKSNPSAHSPRDDGQNKTKELPRELAMYESLLRLPELIKAKEMSESVYNNDIIMKIHFSSWKTWTSDDIADWIVGLENGRFSRYGSVMRQEMKTAKVEGRHLPMLTQNITYLQRFGI